MNALLTFRALVLGCDPEFFFSHSGKIIGADQVLPNDGLVYEADHFGSPIPIPSKIIIDGVQAELNPRPHICREQMGKEIAYCFKRLAETIAQRTGLGVDFHQTIKLDEEDMAKLSDRCKKFGCMPSYNVHDGNKPGSIGVDPAVYSYRSAGGHIHMGSVPGEFNSVVKETLQQHERVVNMLDILVGNTSVLLDRDPGNIERRKVYGRAGEYRTPPHGLEYRTPSNFWLRCYPLMSMVMGLARTAVLIVADNRDNEFLQLVNMQEVAKAINDNDFDLAYSNFKKIEKLLVDITPVDDEHYDLNILTLPYFHHFVKKGLDYWFKQPPLEAWVNLSEGHNDGFGLFLYDTVRLDMQTNG